MSRVVVNRFSAVRLRRHGSRPLCFEGALLVAAGEDGGPQVSLYETADGALAVAIELPGYYTDAWRVDTIDEVAELVDRFDPERRMGLGFGWGLDQSAPTDAAALESPALAMGPAFRRVVDSFIHVSHPTTPGKDHQWLP